MTSYFFFVFSSTIQSKAGCTWEWNQQWITVSDMWMGFINLMPTWQKFSEWKLTFTAEFLSWILCVFSPLTWMGWLISATKPVCTDYLQIYFKIFGLLANLVCISDPDGPLDHEHQYFIYILYIMAIWLLILSNLDGVTCLYWFWRALHITTGPHDIPSNQHHANGYKICTGGSLG